MLEIIEAAEPILGLLKGVVFPVTPVISVRLEDLMS